MAVESTNFRITLDGNTVLVAHSKNYPFWQECSKGCWEPDTEAAFKRYIDRQHSYIDVGAWIGPTVLMGCKLAKHVYAIEPDSLAFEELAENIRLNPVLTSNVQLFRLCVSPKGGQCSFGSRGDGGDSLSSVLFSGGKTAWIVQGITFQDFIEQNRIEDCNFIKMDIEGGEYTVLPTMMAYLKKHRPTLHISLHPCFLGDLEARNAMQRLRRSVSRLVQTNRFLNLLRFYKYAYDCLGKYPSVLLTAPRSLVHHALAKIDWKPMVWLLCSGSVGNGERVPPLR